MLKKIFFATLLLSGSHVIASENRMLFNLWAKIKEPSRGPNRPIGTYSAGCLSGGLALEIEGPGYAIMRTSRKRYYGHKDLIAYLRALGLRLQKENMPTLLIGDLSPPRGGPMLSGHNSHQSGLDVDLWFKMTSKIPSKKERESWSAPSFVSNRKKLKANWKDTQDRLIIAATSMTSVSRVFVSPAIKKHFCIKMPEAKWLYKLRPWWGHEEHLHVRLNCPTENLDCQNQPPLNPLDNGCGSELEWWFSEEADNEWKKIRSQREDKKFPDLPEECLKILRETSKLDFLPGDANLSLG